MSSRCAQYALCGLYIAFYVVDCELINWAFDRFYLTPGMCEFLSTELRTLYTPQFTLMFACVFASHQMSAQPLQVEPLVLALMLCVPWNFFVMRPFLILLLKSGPQGMEITTWVSDYWKGIPESMGNFASAGLAFFFLKSNQAAR